MASINGYTAERMKEIEDAAIIDGSVVSGNLILERFDGTTINAGNVVGPAGPSSFVKCTSITRPPSPTAGDRIFETNTGRELMYDGTGWIIMSEPIQTYSPTINGTTLGNGTIVARYHRSDGWCDMSLRFTLGSSSAITGRVYFALPVSASSPDTNLNAWGGFYDFGGTEKMGMVGTDSSNLYVDAIDTSSTYAGYSFVTATVPFTWAVNDVVAVAARYRMTTRYS